MAHALVISMDRVNGDPEYQSYRKGNNLEHPVQCLLSASGVDLSNGGGLEELTQFQNYLSDHKIIVYDGTNSDKPIFSGNSVSSKKLYLLYDAETGHYNVITNIKAAMAKKYICDACDTLYDYTHKCYKSCNLCTPTTPCTKDQPTYCSNRSFLSEKCLQNRLRVRVKGKPVYQWRQVCQK
jgi:hypothetical protein